ncbi:MAG TPA: hypothetical protein VKR06_40505 [Ktedonosporobacter sp.]|nr:hypothetical protein [Ktedonosporobacter sp.]
MDRPSPKRQPEAARNGGKSSRHTDGSRQIRDVRQLERRESLKGDNRSRQVQSQQKLERSTDKPPPYKPPPIVEKWRAQLAERLKSGTSDLPTKVERTTLPSWLDIRFQGHNDLGWRGTCGIASLAPIINRYGSKELIMKHTAGKTSVNENVLVHFARENGLCLTEKDVLRELGRARFIIDDDAMRLLQKTSRRLTVEDIAQIPRFQQLAGGADRASIVAGKAGVLMPYSEAKILIEQSGDPTKSRLLTQEHITKADVEGMLRDIPLKNPFRTPPGYDASLAARELLGGRSELGGTFIEDQIDIAASFGVPMRFERQFVPDEGGPGRRIALDNDGVHNGVQGEISLKTLGEMVEKHGLIGIEVRSECLDNTLLDHHKKSGKFVNERETGQTEAGITDHAITVCKVEWQGEGEQRVPAKFYAIDTDATTEAGQMLGKNDTYIVEDTHVVMREISPREMRVAWLESWKRDEIDLPTGEALSGRYYASMLIPDVAPSEATV